MFDDTIITEFEGGSRDGDVINVRNVPDYYEIQVNSGVTEIYERQNREPPFIYLQVGYAKPESWR
jgi:hypothetical protein